MSAAKFQYGDFVVLRQGDGQPGVVQSRVPQSFAGQAWYQVKFGSRLVNYRESDLVALPVVGDLVSLLASQAYGGPDGLRRHVTTVKLGAHLGDMLYAYGASKTQLHPYQFIPLLKFLASPYRRILIADEVGLGKTIEAGYILQEEMARGRLTRTLIVCPASLRWKWQGELRSRFGHDFDILNASQSLARIPLTASMDRGLSPLRAIVSLQSIRTPRFIEAVASAPPCIDLLIVDEAHHCRNPKSLQSQAVAALVEHSDAVAFLSATPMQTKVENLFVLLHMLVPEEFPTLEAFTERLQLNGPIVEAESALRQVGSQSLALAATRLAAIKNMPGGPALARTPLFLGLVNSLGSRVPDSPARRVELQEQAAQLNLLSNVFTRTKRTAVTIQVPVRKASVPKAKLTAYEQEVYDRLSDYIFREYEARHGDWIARGVLSTYQRQIASSIPAAVGKFAEAARAAAADWDDEIETLDQEEPDASAAARFSPIRDPAFQRLIEVISAARLEKEDTKFSLLEKSIWHHHDLHARGQRRSRKLIVFSYFRRSLDYLERRLGSLGIRLIRIDGSVPSTPQNPQTDERQQRITRFREEPSVDVLLTSEVGSEGLDFQFCDTVINWDLPWNPMVIEQRIGRVDRIGQRSPNIFVLNLACEGTIEARILGRLYDRIGLFEHCIGELEPILGEVVRELEEDLFHPGLTPSQQEARLAAREQAIVRRRGQLQIVENQAAQLIGHDEHFKSKLDGIRRFGRFVGGDELRLFVEHELSRLAPQVRLSPDGASGVYQLRHDAGLENLMCDALPRGDPQLLRFLTSWRSKPIRLAFDGEKAEPHPDVEPVHAGHPLVRALAARVGTNDGNQTVTVTNLTLGTKLVPPGVWFFVWALVSETGFLSGQSMMAVVIDINSAVPSPVDDETADQLLALMVRDGQPWQANFNPPSRQDAQLCVHAAEQRLMERVDRLDRQRVDRVRAIQAVRKMTLQSVYDYKIRQQQQRTRDMESRASGDDDGAKRILPVLRSRLLHLETEQQLKLNELNNVQVGTASYAILGGGFVRIS